jgi:uncharacterized membrane protein YfcA
MTSELLFPLVGFGASLLAGVSGVGSGSLVAPALIFGGVAPLTAVGTDLAYAAVAKTVAAGYHWTRGSVRLPTVLRLATGSVPGGVAGSLFLPVFGPALGLDPERWTARVLAIVLLLVALVSLWPRRDDGRLRSPGRRELSWPTAMAIGLGVGLIVGMTSVGAGALLGAILLAWSRWEARTVVGSDLAHAALLATAAAFTRATLGQVDLGIAALLLVGGVPGALIGTWTCHRVPQRALRGIISAAIGYAALRLL